MNVPALAQTNQQAAPAAPKPDKPRRIPRRIQQAIRLLASGECKSIRAASERVKMNYGHLCEQLRRPHIEAFLAREAAGNIARAQLRASSRLVELIDAQSEHVAAKVSERILESAGVIKPQGGGGGVNVSIHNNIAAGYVVDLSAPMSDLELKRNDPAA